MHFLLNEMLKRMCDNLDPYHCGPLTRNMWNRMSQKHYIHQEYAYTTSKDPFCS